MGYIKINGDLDVARLSVDNADIPQNEEDGSNSYLTNIKNIGLGDSSWNNTSVMLANMNNSIAGNGADYQFANIERFRVYKIIGNDNQKLYKIYETSNPNERKIKDYIVGDECDYTYYIYPICNDTINNVNVEIISQPIVSEPIKLNSRTLSLMGLIADKENENCYHIDTNEIWLFSLNVKDGGTILNTNKLFSDTMNRYQQKTDGNRVHKSKSVTALLGNIDCTTKQYSDTFEKLEAWDNFCESSALKVLVDIRGRIIVGDIDNSPSIEYGNNFNKEATVSFSFVELTDINQIVILGEKID